MTFDNENMTDEQIDICEAFDGMAEYDDRTHIEDEQGCEDEPSESHDLSDDGDALASAGFGTDEDYCQCEGYDDGEW